jgi:eukaryotic-like serine/threonine-protein kinase
MDENAELYRRLRILFDDLVQRDPPVREACLNQICDEDPTLHRELIRLLVAHEEASSFLERPVGSSLSDAIGTDDFFTTDRFAVLRRLGAGGMGVVYEVQDLVRDEIVALKTMRRATPAAIYWLKQEFRGLAGIAHPNLVCLYELIVERERCFFTMELVKGVNFVQYVRQYNTLLSVDRLRSALRQLIDGIAMLHRLGKLHRDIKPSNVLVTSEGRLVILDFGLIAESVPAVLGMTDHLAGGTPAYVSPEEVAGLPPSEAGDWYGVGATLYEALTGKVPYSGSTVEVLLRKRQSDPPSPSDIAPDVPADVSSICMDLLCRDPRRRLSGSDVLRRLGYNRQRPSAVQTSSAELAATPFVGRERELETLETAFRSVAGDGRSASVSVCGPSGIGKTALLRRFLGPLRARSDVAVLVGRCYEHESVPHEALDGVIDNLSRFLLALPAAEVEAVLPNDVVALPRLFPVMLRVPAIARACREQEPALAEPVSLKRLASDALRELLVRLSKRWRVVISIDDLQWADVDGLLLLEQLLRQPEPPPLLTIVSFRSEEIAGKPFLRGLLEGGERSQWTHVRLECMSDLEAGELLNALLPSRPLSDSEKLLITREGEGSPFVLEQLARHIDVENKQPVPQPTFAGMLGARLDALSADARRFLETLAICGRPVVPDLVCASCAITGSRQSLVATLRSLHLIRSSGSSERVETYHDRIREVLLATMTPVAVRRAHQRMAQTLVDRHSDDCEALFTHYLGADDPGNASIQAGRAAAKAAATLAFDRAAYFYRYALTLAPGAPAVHAWQEELASALANAGRPAEAADEYLAAASGQVYRRQVELQRRGAEQWLIGGHIDRGLDLIRTMLEGMGVRAPRSPRGALLSLLWRRARLRWRGLRFNPRRAEEIDQETLLRIDTCWSATTGLLLVDFISASDFSARHLLMALAAGEPSRVARGMAIESAAQGGFPAGRRLSARLAQQAKALAESTGNPHAIALSILANGILATTLGEWKRALALSEQALAILGDECVGVTWELNIAQNLVIWNLMYLGELGEVSRRVPALLSEARSRGNLYIATELCTRSNYVWLTADEPDQGEREAIESIQRWSQNGFHRQHYSAMLARVQTQLYRGRPEAAWQLLDEHQSMVRRSLMTRVQVIRIEWLYLRARSALAIAAKNGDSRFLAAASAGARRIARERMPWSDPIALLLRAGIAYVEGNAPSAVGHLHAAADRFEQADMQFYLAVTRRRIGSLQNDERGRDLQQRATQWMAEQGIKNPGCMTRMLAPGFPDDHVVLKTRTMQI